MMNSQYTQRTLEIVKQAGVLRPRELDAYGIPRIYLSRLCDQGLLVRIGRGLYMLPEADLTEHHTLAEAAKRSPQAVVCLLSALRFHGLTTQAPFEVWLAIENKAWRPRVEDLPLRFVYFSGKAYDAGIETYNIEGVSVKVYNPAKSVADCFKYRNKIGLDVAVEALRDCLRARTCSVDDLWRYAEICRVANVMRPYMEAIL